MKFLYFLHLFFPIEKGVATTTPFTIETHFHCSLFFLSRFCHYQDIFWLFTLFSIPILPLSRHILAVHSFFCPDSATIETHFHCSLFFCPDSATIETCFDACKKELLQLQQLLFHWVIFLVKFFSKIYNVFTI